jgi:AAA15 family ATPase/GTPase
MFLRSLEIKNYRSLEHVELDKLGKFNVLIGRNNSGKSSVFNALALLSNSIKGVNVEWDKILTSRDRSRSLEFSLVFEPDSEDRNEFISVLAGNLPDSRKEEMSNSSLFRQVEFSFVGSERTNGLWLNNVSLRTEDNRWAVIHKMTEEIRNNKKVCEVVALHEAAVNTDRKMDRVPTSIETTAWKTKTPFGQNTLSQDLSNLDPATSWILRIPWNYLSKAFFFNPFRHSTNALPVSGGMQLNQDGSNLAQVLHTIHNNYRPRFYDIEKFLHAALPDIGLLQTPIDPNNNNYTEIAALIKAGEFNVRLHEMGGGIEQLLMIATVVLTTGDESTLFLEEPESHLHAGAQRFLIERLRDGERQIFVTTHSPTFINATRDRSLYQVRISENRTSIFRYDEADLLSEVLDDIGSRNSDVLLSDAVLFVEGPSDQRVFEIWSEKLGLSLEEHNVTTVPMGGGSDATRGTRARSDVLEGISQKAPVPHLFILDRDERSHAEIAKLQGMLEGRVCLLKRRELENYLLLPSALLLAIRSKHIDDAAITEKIDASSKDEVSKIIQMTADSLYALILMKRVRAELAGLRGGLLPREAVTGLSHKINFKNFPRIIRRDIESRVSEHLDALKINEIVDRVKISLDIDWVDKSQRSWIAPGEEIVAAVFHHFGSEYKKPNDTLRIAREMRKDEIPDEISELIRRVVALTNRVATI